MIKYKVGDKVRLIGDKGWQQRAMKDVGLIGIVIDILTEGTVRVSLNKSVSRNGNSCYWVITRGEGIEKVEGQMLFDFMYH